MAASASANLFAAHSRIHITELARLPAFAVPVLALPALFYLLFGAAAGGTGAADAVLVSYCAFAVLGVVLFQFGVGVASDRESPFERYVRTLPVGPAPRLCARVSSALAFATTACVPVVLAGAFASDAAVTRLPWAEIGVVLLLGAAPFGLLGVALGYWVDPRAAVPTTNLVYLVLAYAGGLFQAPGELPGLVEGASAFLPTGLWRGLLAGAAGPAPFDATAATGLAAWAVVFAVVAAAGYRRDEGLQYR